MKRFSIFPKAPGLEPHRQIRISVISRTLVLFDHRWDTTGATSPSQSGSGSNGNERIPYIPQTSRTRTSPSMLVCAIYRALIGGRVLAICRDSVSVFYSPSRLGYSFIVSLWLYLFVVRHFVSFRLCCCCLSSYFDVLVLLRFNDE